MAWAKSGPRASSGRAARSGAEEGDGRTKAAWEGSRVAVRMARRESRWAMGWRERLVRAVV